MGYGGILIEQVSLRINEIEGRGSQPSDDILSIDKKASRMCVCVPGKSQAILVQFEEKRDFSVAVCLLEKAGFYPSERIPTSLITKLPPAAPERPEISFELKPRLSSIVSSSFFPWNPQGAVAQPDLSFTAMLNAPIQPSTSPSTPTSYIAHPQRTPSVPMQNNFSANRITDAFPVATQLNPYNMFLERDNGRSHVPRVGSPLKYSFSSTPSPLQSPSYDYEERTPENVFTEGSDAQSHGVFNKSGVGASECSQDIAVDSYKADRNLRDDFSPDSYYYQPPQEGIQNFRNLMPRPRKLPFDSSAKITTADRRPEEPENVTPENQKVTNSRNPKVFLRRPLRPPLVDSGKLPTTDFPNRTTNIGADRLGGHAQDTSSGVVPASEKSNSEVYQDAECQTELLEDQNTPDASISYPMIQQEPSDMDTPAWIMLSDCNTLKDLDEVTATLFEQYEMDIANRDFWFQKLKVMHFHSAPKIIGLFHHLQPKYPFSNIVSIAAVIMSIAEAVRPSIEDPDLHTTSRYPLFSFNNRQMSPSPGTGHLSEVFPGVDIEEVRAINSKQMPSSL
ncbi:hypothetical protein F53441_2139 [Fusarium austroafricanum]|uniref:Uncharacterized protein n=1 Tax=Fusarium austroafricanum TaxID=2364996 RepID=A0A8H4KSY7_9HYPO|nr:hypothetical protein F53441_2139 [Fusarium austroafricanum]